MPDFPYDGANRGRSFRESLLGSSMLRMLAIAAAATALLVFVVAAIGWQTCGFGGCPDVAGLASLQPGGAPVLVDVRGEVFADLAPSHARLVRLADCPEYVAGAFLAIEDKRFFEHHGVDLRRVGGAIVANLRSGSIRQGFSTISMQLARSVFPNRLPVERRTLRRKLLEIRVARAIENTYSKNEILELFLNHVYLGNAVRGIGTASREYFGVDATRLTLEQAAMLAALARSPGFYDPRRHPKAARRRRDLVLHLMQEQGRITREHLELALRAPLSVSARPHQAVLEAGLAPYAVEQIRRTLEAELGEDLYSGPRRIFTTIDSRVQRAAEEELNAQLRSIESGRYGEFDGPAYKAGGRPNGDQTPYLQGAVVVLDANTGNVLAWVGGRDFSQSRFDRAAHGQRQPGSAIKPFVYSVALDKGFALSQRLTDAPLTVALPGGKTWKPHNVAGRSAGSLSVRDALVESNNLATVRLAQAVGFDDIASLARRAGFEDVAAGPAIALGSVTVSPEMLTAAYSAFPTGGMLVRPRLIEHVEDSAGEDVWTSHVVRRRLIDPAVAFLISDVLSDAVRRGTGRGAMPKNVALPVAGKTGTTNDVTDAWFIGYTPEIVAGIWIGFDQPRPIVDEATAGRLAAPVFARLMDRIYQNRPIPARQEPPSGVREYLTDPASGLLVRRGCDPSRTAQHELYMTGREPAAYCPGRESPPQDAFYVSLPGGDRRDQGIFARVANVWTQFARGERAAAVPYDRAGPTPAATGRADGERVELAHSDHRPDRGEKLNEGFSDGEPGRGENVRHASGDLSGWWSLWTRIDNTSLAAFRGLRLGYRVLLDQEGDRIVGRGQKWTENGRALAGTGRTAIVLDGEVRGREIALRFREHGTRRTTGGTFVLSWSPDTGTWSGSFRSDAADSSGSASAMPMR